MNEKQENTFEKATKLLQEKKYNFCIRELNSLLNDIKSGNLQDKESIIRIYQMLSNYHEIKEDVKNTIYYLEEAFEMNRVLIKICEFTKNNEKLLCAKKKSIELQNKINSLY
jgi:hypothetical protein